MATFKATDVSNLDATPAVVANVGKLGARMRIAQGNHDITTAYTTGSILVIARIPWHARPIRISMGWDDINDSTQPADLGWYYPDGTVGDIDEFASALALGTATAFGALEQFEAAAGDMDRVGKTLWEWAGLSARPETFGGMCDIALTFGTNGGNAVAGTIAWQIEYCID